MKWLSRCHVVVSMSFVRHYCVGCKSVLLSLFYRKLSHHLAAISYFCQNKTWFCQHDSLKIRTMNAKVNANWRKTLWCLLWRKAVCVFVVAHESNECLLFHFDLFSLLRMAECVCSFFVFLHIKQKHFNAIRKQCGI